MVVLAVLLSTFAMFALAGNGASAHPSLSQDSRASLTRSEAQRILDRPSGITAFMSATTRQYYAAATIRAHCGDFSGGRCGYSKEADLIFLWDCHGGYYKCWSIGSSHAEKHWWENVWNWKSSHGHIRKSDDAVTYFEETGGCCLSH